MLNPLMVMGDDVPVAVWPPGEAFTLNPVKGWGHLPADQAKLTTALALPATAVTAVGTAGTVTTAGQACSVKGVTLFEATDEAPCPALLVANTLKVYAVPLVSPVTVIGEAVPVAVRLPGLAVTVYRVMDAPPLLAGAEKLTLALSRPADAITSVGAEGTVTAALWT